MKQFRILGIRLDFQIITQTFAFNSCGELTYHQAKVDLKGF
jgi:hypothetical protein